LTAEGSKVRKFLKVKVELDIRVYNYLKWRKWRNYGLVIIIGTLPMMIGCWSKKRERDRVNNEFVTRATALKREIDHLSVSKRSSVAAQTAAVAKNNVVMGGKWVRSAVPYRQTSTTSIELMDELLRRLK
jgi:hypothetical protein